MSPVVSDIHRALETSRTRIIRLENLIFKTIENRTVRRWGMQT
jgi:hypothetical protein